MKILNIKQINLLIACFVLATLLANGQAIINDTTINNDVVSLPVIGSTANWSGKTVTYIFEVGWAQFELLDVIGGNNSAVINNSINFKYVWDSSQIVITIREIKPNFINGNLFNIVLKLLTRVDFYFPNEIFEITPKKIIVGDSIITLTEKTAKVNIDYIPANLTYIKDISLNYPNPFYYETNILFSLPEESSVNFDIYNPLGLCVQQIPDKKNDFGKPFFYEIINSNYQQILIENNNVLEKGLYRLRLRINNIEGASGIYYMSVRLGNMKRLIKMGVN